MKVIPMILLLTIVLSCGPRIETEVVGAGYYKSVEYLQGNFSNPSRTIIHFWGGETAVLRGAISIPAVCGDYIEIEADVNGWGHVEEYRILSDITQEWNGK